MNKPSRYIHEMGEIERRYAETLHEDCTDGGPHPLADHEPFDVEPGDEPWAGFEARLQRHGLGLVITHCPGCDGVDTHVLGCQWQ